MTRPPCFVLDHNFPTNLIRHLPWPDVTIVPLRDRYANLVTGHDDWEVIRELRLRGGVDAFVTLDDSMLEQPREMAVLRQSRLSLVVCENTGSDPLIATGLLMIFLPDIARRLNPKKAEIWRLRKPGLRPTRTYDQLTRLADRAGSSSDDLYKRFRITPSPFRR